MADNTSRVTKIGAHLIIVDDGVFVTKFGAYAEILGEDVRITSSGAIVEMQGNQVRVTSSGAIAEVLYYPVSPMATYKASKTGNRAYHTTLPEEVGGYAFDPKWSWWSIIKAKEAKNEIFNGSFEDSNHHLSTFAGWTSHGLNNTDAPGAAAGQYTYKGVAPATTLCEWTYDHESGVGVLLGIGAWTFSVWVYSVVGNYTFGMTIIDPAGPTNGARNTWQLQPGWQRLSLSWAQLASRWAKIRMFCHPDNAGANTIYIDAMQMENSRYATTYFDGDMIGWEDPHPDYSYFWAGIPHQSAAWRRGETNSGGDIISLSDEVGFLTTGIIGLGMHPVDLKTIELDSGKEILVDSQSVPRDFTIAGRIFGCDWSKLSERRNAIIKLLNPQNNAKREPIILRYQPTTTEGTPYGMPLDIKCAYKEGMSGNYATLYQENLPIQMRASEPGIFEELTMAKAVTGQTELFDNGLIFRDKDYLYQNVGVGDTVNAIWDAGWTHDLIMGEIMVVAGTFTTLCGDAVTRAAYYNPILSSWRDMVFGDSPNGSVRVIESNSFVTFFGGDFTASTLGVVMRKVGHWQSAAPTVWNETGDGLTGGAAEVYCLELKKGALGIYVGGDFIDNGGSTNPDLLNIAYTSDALGPSNWTSLKGGVNAEVRAILDLEDGNVIVVGDFTGVWTALGAMSPIAANHIAHWDENANQWGTKFYTNGIEQGFDDMVHDVIMGDDNMLYVAGQYQNDNTATWYLGGFSRWNGSTWEMVLDLFDFTNGGVVPIFKLRKDANGIIWITADNDLGLTVPGIGLCWMFGWKDGVIYPPPYKHSDYTAIQPRQAFLRFNSHGEMLTGGGDNDWAAEKMYVPEQVVIDYDGTFEAGVNFWGQGEYQPSFIEFPNIGVGGCYFAERGETTIASFWEIMQIRPEQARHRVYSNTRISLLNHLNLPATTFSKMKLLPSQQNIVSVFMTETNIASQMHLWWHNRYSSIYPGAI